MLLASFKTLFISYYIFLNRTSQPQPPDPLFLEPQKPSIASQNHGNFCNPGALISDIYAKATVDTTMQTGTLNSTTALMFMMHCLGHRNKINQKILLHEKKTRSCPLSTSPSEFNAGD